MREGDIGRNEGTLLIHLTVGEVERYLAQPDPHPVRIMRKTPSTTTFQAAGLIQEYALPGGPWSRRTSRRPPDSN